MKWEKAVKQKDEQEKSVYVIPENWVFIHYYESLNILFRIENALRIFVYIMLKNEFRGEWTDLNIISDDSTEGTISSIAKKRISQSKSFGYLGHEITCPVMHLTSGELSKLITSDPYWKFFKNYFVASKEVIKHKLEEIGSVRNSLAHFRPVKTDDVDTISQNSKHVLLEVEKLFSQVFHQNEVVPTNTTDSWYRALSILGTEECSPSLYQSSNEQWIRVIIEYHCPIVAHRIYGERYAEYNVLNLKSSEIMSQYSELRNFITYLSERVPYTSMGKDSVPDFRKQIAMVFERKTLEENYQAIKADMEELLRTVSSEIELIKQDNLARGKLIYLTRTSATSNERGGKPFWSVSTTKLDTPITVEDPPEYWGNLGFFAEKDFIAATDEYPWMPEKVSETLMPF